MFSLVWICGKYNIQESVGGLIRHIQQSTDKRLNVWLKSEGKTLEAWLNENPEPPAPEPTKEEQVKAAETNLQSENYALTKMVIELREKLAVATGVKFDAIPAELSAKLAVVDALKLPTPGDDGPIPALQP